MLELKKNKERWFDRTNTMQLQEIEALWVKEAERRLDEMLAGTTQEISIENAFEHARNAIS